MVPVMGCPLSVLAPPVLFLKKLAISPKKKTLICFFYDLTWEYKNYIVSKNLPKEDSDGLNGSGPGDIVKTQRRMG